MGVFGFWFGVMLATGVGRVIATVSMQCRHDDKSKQIETESGTGREPTPKQLPVVAKRPLAH